MLHQLETCDPPRFEYGAAAPYSNPNSPSRASEERGVAVLARTKNQGWGRKPQACTHLLTTPTFPCYTIDIDIDTLRINRQIVRVQTDPSILQGRG